LQTLEPKPIGRDFYLLTFRAERESFEKSLGIFTNAPWRKASAGEKANFKGSFFQAGNCGFSLGISGGLKSLKMAGSQIHFPRIGFDTPPFM